MAKIIPITEHYQHFLAEMKESFWGDVYGGSKLAWKRLLEEDSRWERDRYAVREAYERRRSRRQTYRNGYYERDFVTRLGTIRLRIARTRGKSFLPRALEPFQRRAPEVAMLIREAFLRGISTRQVGRVVCFSFDVSCQSGTRDSSQRATAQIEDNHVEIAQTISDATRLSLCRERRSPRTARSEARRAASRSPTRIGTAPAVGPQVSPATFAEAEKLVEVEFSSEDLAEAASNWRSAMAPLYVFPKNLPRGFAPQALSAAFCSRS